MSEIIMIKTTNHPDIQSNGMPLEAVVGLAVSNERTILEHGYNLTGNESEEVLSGSDGVVGSVYDYFCETQAIEPGGRLSFNCHSFAAYSLGRSTVEHIGVAGFGLSDTDTPPSQLSSVTPYALINKEGQHVHSTLGINRPEYSMGVLGTNNPMVICANGILKYMYNAKHIREIYTTTP